MGKELFFVLNLNVIKVSDPASLSCNELQMLTILCAWNLPVRKKAEWHLSGQHDFAEFGCGPGDTYLAASCQCNVWGRSG